MFRVVCCTPSFLLISLLIMPIGLHNFVVKKSVIKEPRVEAKILKVKPTDTVLKTVGRCIEDFKKKLKGTGLWNLTPRAIARLESRCYWAHMQLAVHHHTIVELDSLVGGRDYKCKLMRDTDYMLDSDWLEPDKDDDPNPGQENREVHPGENMWGEIYDYIRETRAPAQHGPDIRGAVPGGAPGGAEPRLPVNENEAADDENVYSEVSSPDDAN